MLVSGNYRDVRVNDRFNVVGTGVFAGKGHGKVIPAHPLVVDQFGEVSYISGSPATNLRFVATYLRFALQTFRRETAWPSRTAGAIETEKHLDAFP
jgi:hypothetical protein